MSGISAAAWIAIGAAVLSAVTFALAIAFYVQLRNVRRAQKVMIGNGTDDLVDFAVSLQARIDDLHRAVDEVAAGLSRIDKRVDGIICMSSTVETSAEHILQVTRLGVPLVMINRPLHTAELNQIAWDDVEIGQRATDT